MSTLGVPLRFTAMGRVCCPESVWRLFVLATEFSVADRIRRAPSVALLGVAWFETMPTRVLAKDPFLAESTMRRITPTMPR